MAIFEEIGLEMLTRYGHIISGVTWIGLLYYFNFAQTPAFASFEASARTDATAKLVPRAIWWFRWAAMSTLAFGLLLYVLYSMGDYTPYEEMDAINVIGINTGVFFALIMWANVWFVIWPAQRKAIANAQATVAGQQGTPPTAQELRRAGTASRTNTFLSIPMLFFMVAAGHLLSPQFFDTSEGGSRAIWYVVVVLVGGVTEYIALKAPAVGSGMTKHLDDHKSTIIGGFALLVVLYVILELLFG